MQPFSVCRDFFPRSSSKSVLLIPLILACLALSGCGGIDIGDILKDPHGFDGKRVTIKGVVSDRTSWVLIKYFTLSDGTGEITVVTDRAMPLDGTTVEVTGTVREAFSIGPAQMLIVKEEPTSD